MPGMDGDTDELITQLCTRIGMIMEDACMTALTMGAVKGDGRAGSIGELEVAAHRIQALVAAAKALLR